MTKLLATGSLVLSLLTAPVQIEQLQVRLVIPGATLVTLSGTSDPARALPGRLLATANNRLFFTLTSDATTTDIYEVYSITPQDFVKVTDTRSLREKVDSLNGSDPAPAGMTVQALDVDSDGHLLILTDGPNTGALAEQAYLFRVDLRTKALALVSGLDGSPGASSLEGSTAMAVLETTAYITLNDFFGSITGDSIVAIDVHAPDGGKTPATLLTSASQLMAAVGGPSDVIALNDIAVRSATQTLVVLNSGSRDATDDILEVIPTTGQVSVLVAATDIEADLEIPDVGFSGIDVGPRDLIYLANAFGTPGYLATRAIIALADAAGGRATASVYASEREILSVPSIRDMAGNTLRQLGFVNGGLGVHPITGEVFFTETDVRSPATHTNGIIGVQRVTGMEPPPPPYRSRR